MSLDPFWLTEDGKWNLTNIQNGVDNCRSEQQDNNQTMASKWKPA